MSHEVTIICDRCGNTVHGVIFPAEDGLPKITGGFYDVTQDGGWKEFSRGDYEENVCDFCMWSDPKFIEKYPNQRKVPNI